MAAADEKGTEKLSKALKGPIVHASTRVPTTAPVTERIAMLVTDVAMMPVWSEIVIAKSAPSVENITIMSEPSRLFEE